MNERHFLTFLVIFVFVFYSWALADMFSERRHNRSEEE